MFDIMFTWAASTEIRTDLAYINIQGIKMNIINHNIKGNWDIPG